MVPMRGQDSILTISIFPVKKAKGRSKKTIHIVTYDWLEDSLDDGKAQPHVEAYCPGKERDIDAMNAGRSKPNKRGRNNSVAHSEDTNGAADMANNTEFMEGDGEDVEGSAGTYGGSVRVYKSIPRPSSQVASTQVASTEEQQTLRKVSVKAAATKKPKKKLAAIMKNSMPRPNYADIAEQVQRRKEESSANEPARSWAQKVKAHVRIDNHDGFHYHVELKDAFTGGKTWTLDILESTNLDIDKSFRFCATLTANHKVERRVEHDPVESLKPAMDAFKYAFFARTGYEWDERLLRNEDGDTMDSNWLYVIPDEGHPRGPTPSKYTPGHPTCIDAKDLPRVRGKGGLTLASTSMARDDHPRPAKLSTEDQYARLMKSTKRKRGGAPEGDHRSKIPKSGSGSSRL